MGTTTARSRRWRGGYAGVLVLLVGALLAQAWFTTPVWSPPQEPGPAAERAARERTARNQQASRGILTGFVRTAEGVAVPGVEVRVDRFRSPTIWGLNTTTTDAEGRYVFRNLPVSWFQVDVHDVFGQVAPSTTAERATKVVGGGTAVAADLVVP